MKEAISHILVQSINIFRGLGVSQCNDIATKMTLLHSAAGELIVSRNEDNRNVFFMVSGSVRVTSFTENGREASYNDKAAGDLFGELAAIDGSPRIADVLAVTDVTLLTLNYSDFNELVQNDPSINKLLMKSLISEIRSLTKRIYVYSALSVRSRIHQKVYDLAGKSANGSDSVTLKTFPKHSDIASRITTTREAVTREISRLNSLGIIEKIGGHVYVPSLKKFKELLAEGVD